MKGMGRQSIQRLSTSSNDRRINSRNAGASESIVVVVVVDLHYCVSSERLQSEYNCIIVTPDMCVS